MRNGEMGMCPLVFRSINMHTRVSGVFNARPFSYLRPGRPSPQELKLLSAAPAGKKSEGFAAGSTSTAAMKKYQQTQRKEERSSAASPYHGKGRAVRYGECQKNHAAKIGGFAVDGCREFMASLGASGELKCAACGCHKNFHRREIEEEDYSECSSRSTNGK